jgi:ketosteroid isomerase-like protein
MSDAERVFAAYEALTTGDSGPLVALMDPQMEWRGVPHRHFLRKHYPS